MVMNWQKILRMDQAAILAWAEQQPWATAMAACGQDSQWHAEGDVWTHTKLVCDQLTKLEVWPDLADHDQLLLLFTALLHDAAKPLTSVFDAETGHIRSPKHAVKGEHLARGVLRDMDCDLKSRETICALVRYHGRPAFLLDREHPAQEVIRISWLLDNRLLYLFALADTRGRDTDSMQRPEENLHYWKLLAEEYRCLDRAYPFETDHARLVFFRHPEPNLHYVPHEDFSCQVTMMSGVPGSGKDTWLAKHRSDIPMVSLDEVRSDLEIEPTDDQGTVVQVARERCREHVRAGRPFSFNATNLTRQTRVRWIDLFNDYRAEIEIVYLEPPLRDILRQNQQRASDVPESVIRKLAAKVEPPNWLECHQLRTEPWYAGRAAGD